MKQGIGGARPYRLTRPKFPKGGIGGAKKPITSRKRTKGAKVGYRLPKIRVPHSRVEY